MSKKGIFNKLGIRFSMGIFLILAIPAGTTLSIIGTNLKNNFIQLTLKELAYELTIKAEKAMHVLDIAKGEVAGQTQAIEKSIINHPGVEEINLAQGGPSDSFYKSELYEDLASNLRININKNKFYLELRIILASGQELIRFNRSGAGVVQVPVNELQNKADRDYFRLFMEDPTDEVHVAPVSLNQERGKISYPPTPHIKLGKRIYLRDGRLFGVLVLNVNPDMIFGQTARNEKPGYLIIDEGGDYVLHWDKKMLFGRELGHKANLLAEVPELKMNLQAMDSKIHYDPIRKEFRVWKKVLFDLGMASKNYWVFMERHSEAVIESPWFDASRTALTWFTAIIAISLFLSTLFVQYALLPLKTIEKAMQKMGEGDLDARIALKDTTELGHIAGAFNKMADDLREKAVSKNYVDNIIKNMTNALFILSSEFTVQETNQAACDLLGYEKEELLGRPAHSFFSQKELFKGMGIEDLFKKGFLKNIEKSFLAKDGRKIPVLFSASLMRDGGGKIQGIVCVAQDITELKKAEEDLSRLAMAVKQTGDAIVITDVGGAIQYVNPAFERVSGYSAEEAMGQNPRILRSGQTDTDVYSKMWETLLRGEVWTGRFTNKRKDGSLYMEEATISPIRNSAGVITNYVAVKRDMTDEIRKTNTIEKQMQELKRYSDVLLSILEDSTLMHEQLKSAHSELKQKQAQLVQTSKLASIGELAAGVAHEMNQPIMVIRGFTQMMLKKKEQYDEKTQRNLGIIEKSTDRMMSIITHLRTFSRKSGGSPKEIDIHAVLKDAFEFVDTQLKTSNVQIVKNYREGLPPVKADGHQLEQVFLNLISNARYALDEYEAKGGKDREDWEKTISVTTGYDPNAGQIWLEFSDTGGGIPEEYRDKIFDPFFTSKEIGKGTGLGLSISYGIIKEHQGDIQASNSDRGAVFRITLPAVESRIGD